MGRIVTCTLDPDAPAVLSKADREYHDSLSDEELEDAARADPDNLPATAAITNANQVSSASELLRTHPDGFSPRRHAAFSSVWSRHAGHVVRNHGRSIVLTPRSSFPYSASHASVQRAPKSSIRR